MRLHIRQGFTLTELLVAVTIVGLLAAMLFPVLHKAGEQARRTTCVSNERQLGMAILQYVADNDSHFPNNEAPDSGGQWAAQVYPGVKNTRVFKCPDDLTADGALDTIIYSVDSYAINSNLTERCIFDGAKGVGKEVRPSASQAALTTPAKTVLLFEVTGDAAALEGTTNRNLGCAASGFGDRDPRDNNYPNATGCRPDGAVTFATYYATGPIGGRLRAEDSDGHTNMASDSTEPRHRSGANYVACDGHVAWLRAASVTGGQSQPLSGEKCGQDDKSRGCGGLNMAAGTANPKYNLTFSIR